MGVGLVGGAKKRENIAKNNEIIAKTSEKPLNILENIAKKYEDLRNIAKNGEHIAKNEKKEKW